MPFYIEDGSSSNWSEDFSSLKLSKIPSVLSNHKLVDLQKGTNLILSNLVTVNLSNTHLTDFPIMLGKCASLQSLNVSNNNIHSLLFDLSTLPGLTSLDLSCNKLSVVQPSLSTLTKLSYLSVSHNQLSSLPDTMASRSTIRQLFLDNNNLTSLPCWISNLPLCSTLSLANNPLGDLLDLHYEFGKFCRRLKFLELSNLSMNNMPSSLCKLLDLRHLTLSNHKHDSIKMIPLLPCLNRLPFLPSDVSRLAGLVKLQAVGVHLTELPESLHLLSNLEILDISNNSIIWLPSSLSLLPKLKFIDISNNNICMLPLDFEALPNLQHILASYNRISELPENLGLDGKLVTLDVYHNRLYEVEDKLIMSLVRFDLAMNYLKMEHLGKEMFQVYSSKEKKLRAWDENLGEEFVGMLVEGNLRTGQQKVEEINTVKISQAEEEFSMFDIYYGDEEVGQLGNLKNEEVGEVNPHENQGDESEDWANDVDNYDLPAKFGFKY